jgi:D-3-phosphoglycerate dehydrogenase / 2-oxoglutarate reductase
MPEWNVLIADGLDQEGQDILSAETHVDDRGGISAEDLLQTIANYDALIVRSRTKVSVQVLNAAHRLKIVGRAGVGVDNIDLEAARQRGVSVINAPSATTLAVAEQALALMLALARAIPQADAGMKTGRWLKKELSGVEINAKTLGIIGMGNIGGALARRASALGMNVLGYDPLLPADVIRERGAEPADLVDIYQRSDFISLHVPLTAETRGMINRQALNQMKTGVRIICTARGGIIDEGALLEGLETGQVAGAGLDVFAEEPPGLTALVAHPQVIATPHISAQTAEAQVRAAVDIAQEILSALHGRLLRWRVV